MKLSIAEGLYLIALDDEEGRLLNAAEKTIVPGIVSASIIELYIQKKLKLISDSIEVVDSSGTGNKVLDNILQKIRSGANIVDEVNTIGQGYKNLLEDLNQLLVQRGILRKEATKLLWIPLSERMDNANYAFEQEIRDNLRAMVFKKAKPSTAFAVLMSLIHDCNILEEVFPDKDDLIDAVKVAKDILSSPILDEELATSLKSLKKFFKA